MVKGRKLLHVHVCARALYVHTNRLIEYNIYYWSCAMHECVDLCRCRPRNLAILELLPHQTEIKSRLGEISRKIRTLYHTAWNFRGVKLLWMVDLYHFNFYVHVHTHVQCHWAYFTGLDFTVRWSLHENRKIGPLEIFPLYDKTWVSVLPRNQLPIDQLPIKSTPIKPTSHKINC